MINAKSPINQSHKNRTLKLYLSILPWGLHPRSQVGSQPASPTEIHHRHQKSHTRGSPRVPAVIEAIKASVRSDMIQEGNPLEVLQPNQMHRNQIRMEIYNLYLADWKLFSSLHYHPIAVHQKEMIKSTRHSSPNQDSMHQSVEAVDNRKVDYLPGKSEKGAKRDALA